MSSKPTDWTKIINYISPQTPPHDSSFPSEPYVPDDKLLEALDLAAYLKRPLLLEGEPGCGKTRFARAVAYQFGLAYFPWFVKSTSKAKEGEYHYDALGRLHDVHMENVKSKSPDGYIELGVLGQAFEAATEPKSPPVVLIDEIDKADIDFPNDLLSVLDKGGSFKIEETDDEKTPANKDTFPLIIITSNREKPLPDAFLRRCVYHYIKFPDETQLEKIVQAHYEENTGQPGSELVSTAITRFMGIRQEITEKFKSPSTSEFLDWLAALIARAYSVEKLKDDRESVPFRQLLLKQKVTYLNYGKSSP